MLAGLYQVLALSCFSRHLKAVWFNSILQPQQTTRNNSLQACDCNVDNVDNVDLHEVLSICLDFFQILPSHLSLSSCRSRLSFPGACNMRNCASITGECRACRMHWANFKAASSAVTKWWPLCHALPLCHSLALWKTSSTIISRSQVPLTFVILLTSPFVERVPCLLMPSVGAPTTCAICAWEDIPTRLESEGIQCDTQKGPSSALGWDTHYKQSKHPQQVPVSSSTVSGSSDVMVRLALSEGLPVGIYCKYLQVICHWYLRLPPLQRLATLRGTSARSIKTQKLSQFVAKLPFSVCPWCRSFGKAGVQMARRLSQLYWFPHIARRRQSAQRLIISTSE